MIGWFSVLAIVIFELAAAAVLIRAAARGWRDYLSIALLAIIPVRPIALFVTGDISRFLPDSIWSLGSDGKDQIVDASAVSTLLLPLIAAALVLACLRFICAVIAGRLQYSG